MGWYISGTGSALPKRTVTNDDLAEMMDTSDEWIRTRTGISERHICTSETLDELAVEASVKALAMAQLSALDLDAIICSTISGDHIMPAQACAIAKGLGAECVAFDVVAACAGFVFALDVADGMFARKKARNVLIVAAECCSRILDWTDRATCVLFGDGASAAVLSEGQESLLSLRLSTQADLTLLSLPGFTGSSPFSEGSKLQQALAMRGREVFKFGVLSIEHEIRALSEDTGVPIECIDHFIFHQANGRILDSAIERLGIDENRVIRTLAHTGNISSATLPYALDMLVRDHKIRAGQTLAFVGFGAGLSVGSCLMRWVFNPHLQGEVSP